MARVAWQSASSRGRENSRSEFSADRLRSTATPRSGSVFHPARGRGRQPFEIHAVNLGKTVSGKIYNRLCLLKGNVAEQRLVAAVGRLHVDEQYLR